MAPFVGLPASVPVPLDLAGAWGDLGEGGEGRQAAGQVGRPVTS